jgi:HD superfamily phosphodiesterase
MVEPGDADVLVAAGYLHDIGYAPALVDIGFHPLDGARYLRSVGQDRLAGLVAHHSASRFEASARGLEGLLATYPPDNPELADALTYCDLTTGPDGADVSVEDRAADVIDRYGLDHDVSRSIRAAMPTLIAAVRRTEQLIQASPPRILSD